MTDIKPARLTARLFTLDGQTVVVPDVPPPAPATAGKIKVDIPYPLKEKPRTVWRVAVVNEDTGFIARAYVYPAMVALPGDSVTVTFTGEDVSDDLSIRDEDPARPVTAAPGDASRLDAALASLASLNEIVAELTAKVSDDPEFSAMVRELLRGHSHSIGFSFQGDQPS